MIIMIMIYNDDTTWNEYVQYTQYINHLSLGHPSHALH